MEALLQIQSFPRLQRVLMVLSAGVNKRLLMGDSMIMPYSKQIPSGTTRRFGLKLKPDDESDDYGKKQCENEGGLWRDVVPHPPA